MSSDIDELRRELDIVDVISDYIHLERAGTNYRANCPFHPDRTPSFFVSPSKQIFKCFGCGVGGDAIKFVSLYENVSYVQAARELAKRYGIKLRIEEDSGKRSVFYTLIEKVAEFYHSKLKESKEALEYLRSRGIEGSTIRKFKLGYSPPSDELTKLLSAEGKLDTYERTGNLIRIEENRYRDLFKRRLIIPIRDQRGKFVGFGGRMLVGDGPKYINSPESEVFKKRELLYGLYEGSSYLKEFKSAIIVEGYFDVIALHQEGFRNTVATLGTSFGKEHALLLSKFVNKVYLVFDGDEAGKKAMRLAVPHLLSVGIEVYPVLLPEGSDPCDFVFKEGRKALRNMLDESQELFERMLAQIREGRDTEKNVRDFTYFVSFMKDEIKAFSLLSELSKLTKIPLDVLSSKMYSRKNVDEAEEEKLSFTEKLFLKGLFELRPKVNLDDLRLSYRARTLAESIMREEYYDVPEDILNLRTANIEDEFEAVLKELSIDIPVEETRRAVSLRDVIKETIKNHRGGIKPSALRRWRGSLES